MKNLKNWIKLFIKNTVVLLVVLSVGMSQIYADYSSLTAIEKERVKKAFEESKYYKYYQTLDEGRDKLDIIDVELLKQEHLSNNIIKTTYKITLDLIIGDKKFQRVTEWYSETEAIIVSNSSTWGKLFDTAWKLAAGALAGYLIGVLSSK